MIEDIKNYIWSLEKEAIPQLSINCVIFGFHEKLLKVVVNNIQLGNTNIVVLPGGYIGQTESVTDAVERIVKDSTGLKGILLRQFAVFGDVSRSFAAEFAAIVEMAAEEDRRTLDFVSQRFVTICYLALVDYHTIDLKPTQFLHTAQWLPVIDAKTLAIDHHDIVVSARESLLRELPHLPIASNLLPSEFTFPELHALVEAILGRPIDRPNFRRKILKTDMIVKVGQDASGKRRPADLYMFRYGKKTSLSDDFKFGF